MSRRILVYERSTKSPKLAAYRARPWVLAAAVAWSIALTAIAASRLQARILAAVVRNRSVRAHYTFVITPWPNQVSVEIDGSGSGYGEPYAMSAVSVAIVQCQEGSIGREFVAVLRQSKPSAVRHHDAVELDGRPALVNWLMCHLPRGTSSEGDDKGSAIADVVDCLSRGRTPTAITSAQFIGTSESVTVRPSLTDKAVIYYYACWATGYVVVALVVGLAYVWTRTCRTNGTNPPGYAQRKRKQWRGSS